MNQNISPSLSPFQIPNVRRFIAFRIFFNARFYYPIFTILFLDFGMTIEQFAILNSIWAATIVLFEVPSGALADTLGRRNLVVFTAILMVIEIGLLCVVPREHAGILFAVFVVNRILSGLAEASASGADEALAYDSLKAEGNAEDWGLVLEREMRYRSIVFIFSSVIGAAIYDPSLVQKLVNMMGFDIRITQDITLRLPLYLTFAMSIGALFTTFRMRENIQNDPECDPLAECRRSTAEAFRLTLRAGGWIWRTPMAMLIILAGLMFDHVARMVITLGSQYYRLIGIPEATFGIIGSGLAMIGIFIPKIALDMTKHHSPGFNLVVVSALTITGLLGMMFFWPVFGLLPALILFSGMMMSGFFVSHYLNQITDSSQRATVLSFKGLSFNLAYGLIGIFYAVGVDAVKNKITSIDPNTTGKILEDLAFKEVMGWFPGYFIVFLVVFLIFSKIVRRQRLKPAPKHF